MRQRNPWLLLVEAVSASEETREGMIICIRDCGGGESPAGKLDCALDCQAGATSIALWTAKRGGGVLAACQ